MKKVFSYFGIVTCVIFLLVGLTIGGEIGFLDAEILEDISDSYATFMAYMPWLTFLFFDITGIFLFSILGSSDSESEEKEVERVYIPRQVPPAQPVPENSWLCGECGVRNDENVTSCKCCGKTR